MKNLLLIILVLLSPHLLSQGLAEQNKYYIPSGEKLPIGINTTPHQLNTNLDSVFKASYQQASAVETIHSDLMNELKKLEEKAKKDASLKNALAQMEQANKKLLEQVTSLISQRHTGMLDEYNRELEHYSKELDRHKTNITKLHSAADSNKNAQIQWFKDSCSLHYLEKNLLFKAQVGHLKNQMNRLEVIAKQINIDNHLSIDSIFNVTSKEIYDYIKNHLDPAAKDINTFAENIYKEYKRLVSDLAKEQNNKTISTIPALTSLLKSPGFIPQVSMIAGSTFNYHHKVFGMSGEIALIASGNGKPPEDSSGLDSRQKLFINNICTFGILSTFTFGFFHSKKQDMYHLGINLSPNFAGKQIDDDSAGIFNTNIFSLKLGAEFAFFKNLSIYSNFNTLSFLSNIDRLNNYFNIDRNKTYAFFDVGSKFFLDVTKENDFSLFIDFNIIFITPKVKNDIFPSKDPGIPTIKIGLRKKLN